MPATPATPCTGRATKTRIPAVREIEPGDAWTGLRRRMDVAMGAPASAFETSSQPARLAPVSAFVPATTTPFASVMRRAERVTAWASRTMGARALPTAMAAGAAGWSAGAGSGGGSRMGSTARSRPGRRRMLTAAALRGASPGAAGKGGAWVGRIAAQFLADGGSPDGRLRHEFRLGLAHKGAFIKAHGPKPGDRQGQHGQVAEQEECAQPGRLAPRRARQAHGPSR